MTGYRLSKTGTARHPYYLPDLARNLRSVEELCWLVTEQPALIDESITSKALTRWLVEEFAMTGTAIRMERAMKNGGALTDYLGPLLVDADYLTPLEMRAYFQRLEKLEKASLPERLLLKADALAGWRRFGQAIALYQEAAGAAPKDGTELLAKIWHNCGAASMQLLEYEEALADFERAWALTGREADRLIWLLALAVAYPAERFRWEAEARGVPEDAAEAALEEASEALSGPPGTEETADSGLLAAGADELRAAYHREAGRSDRRILS